MVKHGIVRDKCCTNLIITLETHRKAVRSKLGYICDIYGLTNNVNGNHVLEFFSLILGNGLALVLYF